MEFRKLIAFGKTSFVMSIPKAWVVKNNLKKGDLLSLEEDKDHLIISMNKNNPQIFEPYKINIVTGELEQLYSNDDPANPIMGYEFDKDKFVELITRETHLPVFNVYDIKRGEDYFDVR